MADNVIVRVPEQQFIRGEDGYSPEVTIENIDHGHSVTITDRDHPTGQSFNVLDGDSAYEQAVAGGYTGTEAQFNEELASFKELSDETKEAAPFYAEYGVTTKAEIAAAINGKRQIYAYRNSGLLKPMLPYIGETRYGSTYPGNIGYKFALTEGSVQTIYSLTDQWVAFEVDLNDPAQRAEAAADQALIRMNSAAASAQAAATTATTFTEQTVPAAVNTINEAKADALTAVGSAQTTAVGAVQQESTTQQAAIQQKGDDVLESIPSDYTTLTEDVDELKSAVDGYCNLDFSDIVDAYLSTTAIGDKVNFASSTTTKTIKKITQVKRGYIYRISVAEGDTLAGAGVRVKLVLADSEETIFQNDIYFLTAGQTDTIEFTAFGDGYLYLEVDKNYKSISIEGSSVFQAQKASEDADYKVTYLAETGRIIIIMESIRAARYATKHFDLPAGTYHFHCDSVVSTDTNSTVCRVNLGGGSTIFSVNRGVAIDVDVTLPNDSSAQYFYASDNSSHSSGDDVAYNNVIISKAAYSQISDALIDENAAWTD